MRVRYCIIDSSLGGEINRCKVISWEGIVAQAKDIPRVINYCVTEQKNQVLDLIKKVVNYELNIENQYEIVKQ